MPMPVRAISIPDDLNDRINNLRPHNASLFFRSAVLHYLSVKQPPVSIGGELFHNILAPPEGASMQELTAYADECAKYGELALKEAQRRALALRHAAGLLQSALDAPDESERERAVMEAKDMVKETDPSVYLQLFGRRENDS